MSYYDHTINLFGEITADQVDGVRALVAYLANNNAGINSGEPSTESEILESLLDVGDADREALYLEATYQSLAFKDEILDLCRAAGLGVDLRVKETMGEDYFLLAVIDPDVKRDSQHSLHEGQVVVAAKDVFESFHAGGFGHWIGGVVEMEMRLSERNLTIADDARAALQASPAPAA